MKGRRFFVNALVFNQRRFFFGVADFLVEVDFEAGSGAGAGRAEARGATEDLLRDVDEGAFRVVGVGA